MAKTCHEGSRRSGSPLGSSRRASKNALRRDIQPVRPAVQVSAQVATLFLADFAAAAGRPGSFSACSRIISPDRRAPDAGNNSTDPVDWCDKPLRPRSQSTTSSSKRLGAASLIALGVPKSPESTDARVEEAGVFRPPERPASSGHSGNSSPRRQSTPAAGLPRSIRWQRPGLPKRQHAGRPVPGHIPAHRAAVGDLGQRVVARSA